MPDEDRQDDEFAVNLKKLEQAAKLPDDAADIAADDQGASALAQKLGRTGERPA